MIYQELILQETVHLPPRSKVKVTKLWWDSIWKVSSLCITFTTYWFPEIEVIIGEKRDFPVKINKRHK